MQYKKSISFLTHICFMNYLHNVMSSCKQNVLIWFWISKFCRCRVNASSCAIINYLSKCGILWMDISCLPQISKYDIMNKILTTYMLYITSNESDAFCTHLESKTFTWEYETCLAIRQKFSLKFLAIDILRTKTKIEISCIIFLSSKYIFS